MGGDGYNNGFSFPSIELLKWGEVLLQRGLRERGGKEFLERHGYLFFLFSFVSFPWVELGLGCGLSFSRFYYHGDIIWHCHVTT
jgi:hypothetical protein